MINPILFLLCHLIPDYWLQTDWMALNKSKKPAKYTINCLVHCIIYTACFLFLTTSWKALLFIGITHFIIDRYPVITKRMIWIKNHFPTLRYPPYGLCDSTGYFDDAPTNSLKPEDFIEGRISAEYGNPRPYFITIWIYIISDNILHLLFNYIALTLLI